MVPSPSAMMSWNRAFLWVSIFLTCAVLTRQGSLVPGEGYDFADRRERRQATNITPPGSPPPPGSFLQGIVDMFGADGGLTQEQLQELLTQVNAECYSAEQLLWIYSLSEDDLLNDTAAALQEICPTVLYQAVSDGCGDPVTEAPPADDPQGPTIAQVWGYGLLCVTIINLGSLMGAFVVPCMDKNMYKLILTYLVGLAVGTLTGSALLHLIPKTHGLKVKRLGNELVWKNACILLGIYIFFVAERILKIISTRKEYKYKDAKRRESVMHTTAMHDTRPTSDDVYKITSGDNALSLTENMTTANNNAQDEVTKENGHGHSHGDMTTEDGKVRIATVAYMIICGDGLHNFVDGLAIGASFTTSLLSGFSTSIAIACEEFPHELGDFAVLLKSGMTVKQAMGFNFMSSMTCYGGLVVGIVVGRLTDAEPYIFALAAGMFLYIALVDMLPEITNVASSKGKFEVGQELLVFLLQNAGILSGFGIMILLSVLHPYIKIKG